MHTCQLSCPILIVRHSPVCSKSISEASINEHLDADCATPQRTAPSATTTKRQAKLAPIFRPLSHSQPHPPSSSSSNQLRKRVQGQDGAQDASSSNSASAKRARTSTTSAIAPRSTASSSIPARPEPLAPLPDRLRPTSLEHYVGHPHLTAPDSPLQTLSKTGALGSIIFWGPPGYLLHPPSANPSSFSFRSSPAAVKPHSLVYSHAIQTRSLRNLVPPLLASTMFVLFLNKPKMNSVSLAGTHHLHKIAPQI